MLLNCPEHGIQPLPGFDLGPGMTATFVNSGAQCPICGRVVPIIDGKYEVVSRAVRTFGSAPRQSVVIFRDIAQSVQQGSLTPADAVPEVEKLGSAFAQLWDWTNNNGPALSVLLGIIMIYLQVTAMLSADDTASKLQSSEAARTQIEQQILAELQKQSAIDQKAKAARPAKPNPGKEASAKGTPNRHERLKAQALDRKRKKKQRD